MYASGTIFHHPAFAFPDSSPKPRFFILLNKAKEDGILYLVACTSQHHGRPENKGCLPNAYYPSFFIPVGSTRALELPTWVNLENYYRHEAKKITKVAKPIALLSQKITKNLIACFLQINDEDLPPIVRDEIVSPAVSGAAALAAKFNKKR